MRHFYLIVDPETTKKQTVADFGAVIVTKQGEIVEQVGHLVNCLLYTSPSPRDLSTSRMPSSA